MTESHQRDGDAPLDVRERAAAGIADSPVQAPQDHHHADHADHAVSASAHGAHGHHAAPMGHGDHADHGGHGDHAAMFRRKFWLSLVLAVPVLLYSETLQDLLGYVAPAFPGSTLITPVLGTAIFFYGGWPFLSGAADEIRNRRPGMMLLIGMAITVAFGASLATSLGLFSVEVWWELALLIVIMLLGHWLEMRDVGQASGALAARPTLSPEGGGGGGDPQIGTVGSAELGGGEVGGPPRGGGAPADGTIVQ